MELRYLRFNLFRLLMAPFSGRARQRRMDQFATLMGVRPQMSILDMGGQPSIWHMAALPPMNITILNLPGVATHVDESHHRIEYVEGDGCNVSAFADGHFDCVFSNSVIEHVGGPSKQAQFAAEVRRLGRTYWVQTPAKIFPIEAHSGMPLWWYYPPGLRRYFIKAWRPKLPAWTEMVETTTVLTKQDMIALFPGATIRTERVFWIPKSYIAYRSD